ncbi:MAG: isocitrate/isopropylmalate family dehydrogenase [Fimbriimonadales bacterium]|nr:isocitrate/isopropylmalate family dehydrogenase [Fimbriimonadales bacterium]
MNIYTVTLIRGDGIGPEIAESVVEIFAAAEVPIQWEEAYAGLACLEQFGVPIPDTTLESIRRNRIALKGPTTTPIGRGHRSINVAIRKAFELFANVRPARSIPGVQSRYNEIDLILVRENIEDTYAGVEYWQTPDVAESLRLISRPGSSAVIRYAFDLARRHGRRKVTCVHKANIQKLSDGLFLECFRAIAQEYPDIESDDILVDNACMQLVMRPERFDVMVLPNLFGDIVSDLCAGLIGGLGVAPGGNIGNGYAVFEAVHGSAPDIAGKGIANPTAFILSAVQMLHHLGLHADAERIENALRYTLVSGIKTRDLGGNANTREFTKAIISNLPPRSQVQAQNEPVKEPYRTPMLEPRSVEREGWQTVGVDIFFYALQPPTSLPDQVGKLHLQTLSNRGVALEANSTDERYLLNWFRARYVAENPVSEAELQELLSQLAPRLHWTTFQRLYCAPDGTALFSPILTE